MYMYIRVSEMCISDIYIHICIYIYIHKYKYTYMDICTPTFAKPLAE